MPGCGFRLSGLGLRVLVGWWVQGKDRNLIQVPFLPIDATLKPLISEISSSGFYSTAQPMPRA